MSDSLVVAELNAAVVRHQRGQQLRRSQIELLLWMVHEYRDELNEEQPSELQRWSLQQRQKRDGVK